VRPVHPALLVVALTATLSACSSSSDGTPVASPAAGGLPSPSALPSASAPASDPASPSPGPEDPLSPQPALESAPPLGLPTCRAAALTLVDADSVVTTTAVQEVFVLRTSGPNCQLEGFPTVELYAGDGTRVAATVRHNGYGLPDRPATPVTLSRGTSTSFVVATSRSGDCTPLSELRATVPGTGGQLRAQTPMEVCGGAVGVSPVRRSVDDHAGGEG
jgi:hypothetical protein